MEPRLSPRLQAVAAYVPSCHVVADIGTDHGFLPAALIRVGRATRAIASDCKQSPLARARCTARELGLEDQVDFRLGDGLSVLAPGEADCAIIAGMGGETIAAILNGAPWAVAQLPLLVLQPMTRAEILRKWLPENGYAVRAERLVEDRGKIYPILVVAGGAMPSADAAQAWGGFHLKEDPLWGRYLTARIQRLERAAAGLAQGKDPALAAQRQACLCAAAELKQRKGEWEDAHSTSDRKDSV